MTKYYFASYISSSTKAFISNINGCSILKVVDLTLVEVCDLIQKKNNLENPVVITCLKDLTEEEYQMLSGLNKKTEQQ